METVVQEGYNKHIKTDKIMVLLGRSNPRRQTRNELEKNDSLIRDLDILIIKENKGLNRSEKILELIEKEVNEKRDLIYGSVPLGNKK